MIRAEGLVKRFNNFAAVDGVTFSVEPGRILALLGPNGAGKTTTVRMLSAILMPTEGRAIVGGYDTRENPTAVRRQVGLLTEQPALYLRMRGGEYLEFFGRLYGLSPTVSRKRGREWLERLAMPEAWERRIGEYSKGMRQKLALVRAFLHDPPVLLLDEPTSAMDPHSAKLVRDAILSLRDVHRTILVCTHNLNEAELIADEIAIIRRGRIVARGTPAQLKRQLLGPPLMELRLVSSVDGVRPIVARWAPVVDEGPGWIRYQTEEPETVNPLILQALFTAGIPVMMLSEVPRSLESVYLRVVELPT